MAVELYLGHLLTLEPGALQRACARLNAHCSSFQGCNKSSEASLREG